MAARLAAPHRSIQHSTAAPRGALLCAGRSDLVAGAHLIAVVAKERPAERPATTPRGRMRGAGAACAHNRWAWLVWSLSGGSAARKVS